MIEMREVAEEKTAARAGSDQETREAADKNVTMADRNVTTVEMIVMDGTGMIVTGMIETTVGTEVIHEMMDGGNRDRNQESDNRGEGRNRKRRPQRNDESGSDHESRPKFPTWLETVNELIDQNLSTRKPGGNKAPRGSGGNRGNNRGSGGGSRGGSGGNRGRGSRSDSGSDGGRKQGGSGDGRRRRN